MIINILLIIIWLISYLITGILFIADDRIPFNLGNFILTLIPILNTLIAIKLLKGINVLKEMKNTLNIVFKK